ncbi:MAG: hypothetical protein FJZ01_27415 [Candidatus Sericytochromatia bacterium]|nr:hypothetical protein [Candidatus Tanganyikabacteria bacterium]
MGDEWPAQPSFRRPEPGKETDMPSAPVDPETNSQIDRLEREASQLAGAGRFGDALLALASMEILCREADDKAGLVASLTSQGQIHDAMGLKGLALGHYKLALEVAQELGHPAARGELMFLMAGVYREAGDFQSAERLLAEMESLSRNRHDLPEGDLVGIAKSNLEQSLIQEARGQIEEAVRLVDEALDALAKTGNPPETARFLGHKIGFLVFSDRASVAWQVIPKMEELCRDRRGAEEVEKALTGLITAALDSGKLYEVGPLIEAAERVHRLLGDERGLAVDLEYRGQIGLHTGDLGQSRQAYAELARMAHKQGDKLLLAKALDSEVIACLLQGDTAAARPLSDEALSIYEAAGEPLDLARCLLNRSNLFRASDRREAIGLLEQAMRLFSEAGDLSMAMKCFQEAAELR